MAQQITWIKKPGGSHNPSTHITEVGGNGWNVSANTAIHNISNNPQSYFVHKNGVSVWVGVGMHNGTPYLHTLPDRTPLDNLLSLENRA